MTRMVLISVAAALLAAGCSGGDETPAPAPESPRFDMAPEGSEVVIEPLRSVPGAERATVAGVGIDVPDGMTAETRERAEGVQQVLLWPDGEDRTAVIVTVTAQPGADEATVDASAVQSEAELAISSAVSDLERRPAAMDGIPYAVLTTFTLTVDDVDDVDDVRDGVVLTMHDPDNSAVVNVWAEAAQGTLESSEAWAALRTVRFDG